MTRRLASILTVLTVLAVLPAGAAFGTTEFTETTESLFLFNNNGTDCAARTGLLVYEANAAGSGCGYIYGAPIGEVDRLTGAGLFENARTYTTETTFTPVILDGGRTITGVVTVTARQSFCASPAPVPCVPHTGVGSGVGQIIVDLAFGGLAANAAPFQSAEEIATATVEATILPGQTEVKIPFTMQVPASAAGKTYRALSFTTDTHGLHINTGYLVTDGRSTVDVPTLTPVATD